jgi:proline iminopeptidase
MVMAHSFGGILATEYASNYSPAIKAMVYLNCTVNLPATALSGLTKGVELLGNKSEDVRYFLNDSVPI